MNETILSGPNLAFVGISTVFAALVAMVGAIVMMKRLIAPDIPKVGISAANVTRTTAESTADMQEHTLRDVALAAYAFHSTRSVRVPSASGSSPWQRAGRAAQVVRRQPRG